METLVIPLGNWASGEREFRFHVETEFFQAFGNTEILDADVSVEVRVSKQGARKVEADLHLSGSVTVPCDRCLERVTLPVEENQHEELPISETDAELDLSQVVYDYVCLSMPLQRVHPDGGCDETTVRFLCHEEREDEEAAPSSPFAALKGLFDGK